MRSWKTRRGSACRVTQRPHYWRTDWERRHGYSICGKRQGGCGTQTPHYSRYRQPYSYQVGSGSRRMRPSFRNLHHGVSGLPRYRRTLPGTEDTDILKIAPALKAVEYSTVQYNVSRMGSPIYTGANDAVDAAWNALAFDSM